MGKNNKNKIKDKNKINVAVWESRNSTPSPQMRDEVIVFNKPTTHPGKDHEQLEQNPIETPRL